MTLIESSYLLLLHQFRWGAIIADIFSKDRQGEASIDISSTDFAHGAIEYKIVALWSKAYRMLLANEDEREYITIL
jgi:hypothetical protein